MWVNIQLDLLLQRLLIIAGQPANDGIDFIFAAIFSGCFLHIQRINTGKRHRKYFCVVHINKGEIRELFENYFDEKCMGPFVYKLLPIYFHACHAHHLVFYF